MSKANQAAWHHFPKQFMAVFLKHSVRFSEENRSDFRHAQRVLQGAGENEAAVMVPQRKAADFAQT